MRSLWAKSDRRQETGHIFGVLIIGFAMLAVELVFIFLTGYSSYLGYAWGRAGSIWTVSLVIDFVVADQIVIRLRHESVQSAPLPTRA